MSAVVKVEIKQEEPCEAVHPRKRKIKMKEPPPEVEPPQETSSEHLTVNCFEMFQKIRKQVCFILFCCANQI